MLVCHGKDEKKQEKFAIVNEPWGSYVFLLNVH